jgi:hypothetical protein
MEEDGVVADAVVGILDPVVVDKAGFRVPPLVGEIGVPTFGWEREKNVCRADGRDRIMPAMVA